MKTVLVTTIILLFLTACSKPEKPTVTLYLAMQRGDIEQIERHIAWGSDLDRLDRDGYTPLHVAVRNGRLAITRLLLKQGVDVDKEDARGHTPIYHAIYTANPRIADLLLQAGAKLHATSMLIELAHQGIRERESVRYLVEHGADLEAKDEKGDTPLLIAIRQGNHKLAKHLVNFGADVTVTDSNGQTALQIAKSLDLSDIALLLRRNGAT